MEFISSIRQRDYDGKESLRGIRARVTRNTLTQLTLENSTLGQMAENGHAQKAPKF